MRLTIKDAKIAFNAEGEMVAWISSGELNFTDEFHSSVQTVRIHEPLPNIMDEFQLAIESAIARGETEVEVKDD